MREWFIFLRLRFAAWVAGRHMLVCNAIINENGAALTIPNGTLCWIKGGSMRGPTGIQIYPSPPHSAE